MVPGDTVALGPQTTVPAIEGYKLIKLDFTLAGWLLGQATKLRINGYYKKKKKKTLFRRKFEIEFSEVKYCGNAIWLLEWKSEKSHFDFTPSYICNRDKLLTSGNEKDF